MRIYARPFPLIQFYAASPVPEDALRRQNDSRSKQEVC